MGVPKFYRWTSERYPCLSQVIKEHQIPEFDNLYFDMNGIIHVCSHPNDDDPHFRITEADIFNNIFHYIEVLFRIIKPKKNFFMAVDGVAPRAKMNQQRGRRFRTAKEAEDNIRRALQKGQSLPKEERFDSNCITPGTEFMTRLNDHLQYFVNKKISSDPLWQGCNVYLSGHDVPGEGEHKIMDFIRYEKSQDDYDPNTRHCLYGLDADLIVLGLATHEPHLSLLREEVRFGKQSKRVSKPEETTFHLLHLSLMREYLDFEFSALKDSLSFKYDLEKIIDDWVLLGFLVGNDFIPHLPNLHINHDALPYLYKVYIETMPKLDGYLHDGGTLNLPRFQKFMDAIGKFDREKFEDIYTDMKWLEGRTGRSLSSGKKSRNGGKVKFSKLLSQMDDDIMFPVKNPYMALADVSDAFDDSLVASPPRVLDRKAGELEEMFGDMGMKDTDGGEELFEMEFRQHKRAYYTEKFDIPTADDAFISTVVYEYVLAIQWILHYYFNGLQSWSWYYPFHYAPFVSDISNTDKFDLAMNKGEPFKPFEQLLAVLPSASKKLLPDAFQSLMIMDTSPIIDYYPTSFQTDLNGKQQEWEAVVLIPFIDEQRLLSAMASNYARLTDEEKERNSYGSCLKYRYSIDVNYFCPTTYPGVFQDIDVCRASCEKIDRDAFRVEIEDINKGLCDGVKENVYFPGFPTLKHINHHSNLRKAGVRVFQFSSKSNNMVIHIEETEKPDKEAMRELVGQIVHVEWPYLVEALVTAVTDGEAKYVLKEAENIVQEDIMNVNKSQDAKRWMKIVKTNNLEKKGIDIGEVHALVEAKQLKGKRYVCGAKGNVNLEREWAATHSFYPYQSIVQNLSVHTSEFQKECKSIEELYPEKSQCFMMANPHYGCLGEVLEVDKETSRVRVALSVPPEPDLADVITNQSSLTDKYQRIETAAQKIGISSKLLSRITGNLFIRKISKKGPENGEKVNLGLKLKFSGRNREVLGYARREEDGWKFSESAINVLRSYVKKFPKIFEKLAYLPEQESYGEEDIFPGKTGKDVLEEVLKFLKNLPCAKVDSVKCGSNVLDERVVTAIETAVEETKLHKHMAKCVKVKVKPYVLFKPMAEFGSLVPDPSTEYYLFDRVVNVRDGGAVPLGYRGTIIGVHEVQEDEKDDDSPKEIKYEVLFDEPFLGGLMLRCQENKGAYVTSSSTLNISYGERKEAKKKGQTPTLTKLQGKAEPKSIKKTSSSSSLQGYSPFSPPRGRDRRYEGAGFGSPKESTPTSSWHDRTDYRQSPGSGSRFGSGGRKKHDNEDNFKPDYWLKDYGNKTPERGYSRGEAEDNGNKKKSDSKTKITGTDFLAMLTKIDKNDEDNKSTTDNNRPNPDKERQDTIQIDPPGTTIASKSPASSAKPKSKTLQEETALLQKMLGIGSHSQQQMPTQEMGRIPNTSFHTPPRQPTSIFNQLFHGPQSSEVRMNVPASPTSPLTPGSLVVSPTSALQNWCHQNQMPAPNYTYSCTPQGVHAVVRIGPAICFGGQMCRSKPDAAESAAAVALKHLVQRQNEVEEAIAAGNHPSMQTHNPNQGPFISRNQQMLFNAQFAAAQRHHLQMSPAQQQIPPGQQQIPPGQQQIPPGQQQMSPAQQQMSPAQQQMSPAQQQIPPGQRQMSPAQAHQMQQAFLLHHGHHPGYRPPSGHQMMGQPQLQQFPQQRFMHQSFAPLIMPSRPQMTSIPQNPMNAEKGPVKTSDSTKGMTGNDALQAAFIPLQVNRASKASAKKKQMPTDQSSAVAVEEADVDKNKVASNKISDAPKKSADIASSGEPSDSVNKRSPEAEAVQTERKESLEKPPKEKTKKKVLLAPSFFAPKK